MEDSRFKSFRSDPRSRKVPRNVSRVKIDERFHKMFKNRHFDQQTGIDKRGRRLDLTAPKHLKSLYNVEESSEEDSDASVENAKSSGTDSDLSVENANSSGSDSNSAVENTEKLTLKTENNIVKIKKEKCIGVYGSNNVKHGNKQSKTAIEDVTDHIKLKSSKTNLLDNAVKDIKKIKKKISEIKKEKCDYNELEEFQENPGIKKSNNLSSKNRSIRNNASLKRSNVLKEEESSDGISKLLLTKQKSRSCNDLKQEETDSENEDNETSDCEMSENDPEKDSEDEDTDDESEDSDESDKASSKKSDEFDHDWEELDKDASDTDVATRRLALCNMDWDRIRVDDLYVAFSSFKPELGNINSVTIYPSEFGLKRMEEEKLHGPAELVEETVDEDEKESKSTKGSKYHREKLRQYQLMRLKYYYAVIDCDSAETANTLYEQLNGMEYESSSIRFDLRFIPDDMTFDQEPVSVANKVPDSSAYKPRLFANSALQQVKVNLTWDETDPRRREILQKAFTEPESIEEDIKEYLASTSGDSDDENEERDDEGMTLSTKEKISQYKALLQDIDEEKRKEEEAKGFEMEITWVPGLKEKTEEIAKKKMEAPLTPFEEIIRKKKEERKSKKKNKKPDLDLLENDSDESDIDQPSDRSFDQTTSKKTDELYLITDSKKKGNEESSLNKKRKQKKKVNKLENPSDFKCNVADPRFSAVYTSYDFNIDPSHPNFKHTPGALAIVKEKQKRLQDDYTLSKKMKNKKTKYMYEL